MMLRTPFVLPLLLALALALVACDDRKEDATGNAPPVAETPLDWVAASALNDRAIILMDQGKIGEAIPLFEELVRRTPKELYAPRFNLAVAFLNSQNNDRDIRMTEMDRAEALFDALCAEAPDRPEAHYSMAILLEHLGRDRARIRAHLEACRRLAPNDPNCVYRLGKFLFEEGGDALDEAEPLLTEALRLDPQLASAWNTLFGTLRRLGAKERAEEAMRLFRLYSDTKPERGRTLSLVYNFMGDLACCIRRLPRFGATGDPAPATIVLEVEGGSVGDHALPIGPPERDAAGDPAAYARAFATSFAHPPALDDLDGDGRIEIFLPRGEQPARLFTAGTEGFEDVAARWRLPELPGTVGGIFADVDHDERPDLFVFGAGSSRLFLNRAEGLVELALPPGENTLTVGAQVADLDADGDLDLFEANFMGISPSSSPAPARNRLLSNLRPTIYEEADERTAFAERGVPELADSLFTTAALWVDLDRDGDLDLALGESSGGRLATLRNDRLFRFTPGQTAELVPGRGAIGALIACDLDGDGDPDLVAADWSERPSLRLVRSDGILGVSPQPVPGIGELPPHSRPYPADLDNDGDCDLVLLGRDGRTIIARNDAGRFATSAGPRLSGHGLAFHDLDGDGLLDAIFADPADGRPRVAWNRTKGAGRGLEIALRGKRSLGMADTWSTRFGTGASVEVAAAGLRTTAEVMSRNGTAAGTGPTVHVGLGPAERADFIRILWPDLVLQSEADSGARPLVIEEVNRKASSCPVLFKPDGRGGWAFVTDFLGVGGLGFFLAPGQYAPPDRDETVRIGELEPVGDRYELRVHEPMEEISYLDSFRLLAVDHPAGTEVQVDERLATAEPMPSGRPLLFGASFLPVAARSDAGRDCLAELAAEDRIYQPDLRHDRRFLGYLEREQALELDFDAAAIAAARPGPEARLWMFLDGFVEYPYSHVNYAAWEAGVEGRSFSIDVADGNGGWREIVAGTGYPAGMTRCMAADLSSVFAAGIHRIRLRTNLDIRVDRVRLAWAEDDELMARHRRSFARAELRFAGYPEERSPDGREPKLYDYQRMSPSFDWKVMGGRYSAFGEVTELLGEADERMVVMGHGEELVLEIPVSALPPVPAGMIRTFFLEAEGYCKDMDPLTAFGETVAPLPQRAAIDYPLGLRTDPRESEEAPRERVVPRRLR